MGMVLGEPTVVLLVCIRKGLRTTAINNPDI
jgi:hypothetical protein